MIPDALKDLPLTEAAIDAVLYARSFRDFIPAAWPQIEPKPLIWNWHLDALAEHLQAVSEGQIKKLLVNVPPGTSKSLVTAGLWPAWEWNHRPEGRWFFASYDQQLSTRDSIKTRNLILSAWYRERWAHVFKLAGDQNLKTRFDNDKKGYRLATSVRGHGIGEHPDRIVIDDPHDPEGAESELERKATLDWWDGTLGTRGAAANVDVRTVIIMQRLNENDLSGHVLKEMGWTHLCLPMRYEPGRQKKTVLGFTDPRKKPGELLAPEQYPEETLQAIEMRLGPYRVAGQMQQRPTPAGGGIVKRHWWRFWVPKDVDLGPAEIECHHGCGREDCPGIHAIQPVTLPEEFDVEIDSWDATFKRTEKSDFVAGLHMGRLRAGIYITDRVNARMDFPETVEAVRRWRQLRSSTAATLVEDKANGPAIISTLQHEILGMLPIDPEGDKQMRMDATSPLIKAGNVYLPHPALYPWVNVFIEWVAAFPNAEFDDDVDALSQGLRFLQHGAWAAVARAHREAKNGPPPRNLEEAHQKKTISWIKDAIRKRERDTRSSRRGGRGGEGMPGL